MKHPAADLLAQDFGQLQHTNNRGETGLLHMPGFHQTGMSDEQSQHNGTLALALAEGIIETLEQRHGYRVIAKDDLNAKIAAEVAKLAAAPGPTEKIIICSRCRAPLFRLRLDREHVKIDTNTVNAAYAHMQDCR